MTKIILTKVCSKCKIERPISYFSKDKYKKDGLCAHCKLCHQAYCQTDNKKAANKKYQQSEKGRKGQKEYRQSEKGKEANLKYVKKYQKTEKGKITRTKANKKYSQSEKGTKSIKKYQETNKEAILAKTKKWCQSEKGKESLKKRNQKRRALKRTVMVEDFSPSEVFERDGYKCQSCGIKTRYYKTKFHSRSPELDHIIPLSLGGEHSKANTQCLCSHCNRTKHNTGTGDQLRLFG